MKKIFSLFILALFAAALLSSCSAGNKNELGFYVIDRSQINASMSDSQIVSAVRRDGRLAFESGDIKGYNWQTHTVVLKEESVPSIGITTEESGGSAVFKTDDTYAFALVLGNELIYSGGFRSGVKNPAVPMQPCITDTGRYSFSISFDGKYATFADPRSDSRLYGFLNKHGLLSSKTE